MARKLTDDELQDGRDEIHSRLHEAIEGLRKDVTRVEIWATALGSFSQPVPDYRPESKFDLSADSGAARAPISDPKMDDNSTQ